MGDTRWFSISEKNSSYRDAPLAYTGTGTAVGPVQVVLEHRLWALQLVIQYPLPHISHVVLHEAQVMVREELLRDRLVRLVQVVEIRPLRWS